MSSSSSLNEAQPSASAADLSALMQLQPRQKSFDTDSIMDALKANPTFNAGAGLAGMGLAWSLLRRAAVIGTTLFRRRFLISLRVSNDDVAYTWLLDFINKHSSTQTRRISANTVMRLTESGKSALSSSFLPSFGQHIFIYDWRWITVERDQKEQSLQTDGYRRPFETVTLTTLGTNPEFFKKMLNRAKADAVAQVEKETGIVLYKAVGPQWVRFGDPKRKKSIKSVVLDGDASEKMVKDLQDFIDHSQWYFDRNIPYRRGYLLYGPPGTGKSSFIAALASHFGYSICTFSLSEVTLDDDRLNVLLNTAPANSIIAMEDIDAALANRDKDIKDKAYSGMTRVSLSGILNALDGVASSEGRLIFMTTNHVDQLDSALIRPGRIDYRQYFGFATEDMMRKMFRLFYDTSVTEEQVEEFVEKAVALKSDVSPADLQGHFLVFKEDARGAIENIENMLQKQKFIIDKRK